MLKKITRAYRKHVRHAGVDVWKLLPRRYWCVYAVGVGERIAFYGDDSGPRSANLPKNWILDV